MPPVVEIEVSRGFRELFSLDRIFLCRPRGMTVEKAALQISTSLLPMKMRSSIFNSFDCLII